MNRRIAAAFAGLILAGAVYVAAEPALDELVQAGRFSFYRDHADPHKYYYVPDAPRLATKRDGTPEFTFIKYTKTDGATKGGVCHFLVTWGYSSAELSTAESALQGKDPEARIAGPVPFKEGTFRVISATAGEGGLFNRRIVGEGKAPVMPGQKAAVSIALTEEGASLLWESFKNPTSDISVQFVLKFTGVTPAFQAKLKVNWDKVYTQHDIRLHAEAQVKVVKLEADVRAILEELRQQGAIQLEVVGENESMQKMLDAVYTHLLAMMCDKVPTGTADAAAPPVKKVPAAAPRQAAALIAPVLEARWLGELIEESEERLRSGPFEPQDQQTATCDGPAMARWKLLWDEGVRLFGDERYPESIDKFKQAYAACPVPATLYFIASGHDKMQEFSDAKDYYMKFIEVSGDATSEERTRAASRISLITTHEAILGAARSMIAQEDYLGAVEIYQKHFEVSGSVISLYNAGMSMEMVADKTGDASAARRAADLFERFLAEFRAIGYLTQDESTLNAASRATASRERLLALVAAAQAGAAAGQTAGGGAAVTGQAATAAERQARRQAAQAQAAGQSAQTGGQTGAGTGQAAAGAQSQQTTASGTKPPSGQPQTAQQSGAAQTQTASTSSTQPKPPAKKTPSTGQPPPAKPGAKPAAKPETKPAAKSEASQPLVKVQLGYTFKRIKLTGSYEVDMRKRLREDREMVMSGNVGGLYQTYGEDKRFFTIVSLDDPTFQERSIEVILDGQDAEDFKNSVNSVSVLFRKSRFGGPEMTGEVKFFEQQFADRGNRLSFKYGRLNEASTEWLDYEYRPKWSFYGGVEWEGEWTKTSDSVLTLASPCGRRTLEISVDEDNILKNNIKALAIQIRHRIFGKDITKEVVIDYDKGDPLQARYTYFHEEGSPGYSYKVIWLLADGREVQTAWLPRESPFIFAVFANK